MDALSKKSPDVYCKLTSVVEITRPDRLSVLDERGRTIGLHEIPKLDCPVSRCGRNVASFRVEGNATHPILMPLA